MKYFYFLTFLTIVLKSSLAQIPSLDATFNTLGYNTYTVGSFYHDVRAVHQQSNGKIISAFTAGAGSSNYDFYATRYLANGTIDNTYGLSGVSTITIGTQTSELNSATLQSDDKLVMVGWAKNIGGAITMGIARIDANGILDNTFNSTGTTTLAFNTYTSSFTSQSYANAVHVQANGKILVAGSMLDTVTFTQRMVAIARLNANGSIDNTFANNGRFLLDLTPSSDEIYGITTDANGNIYATAQINGTAIIKLTSAGVLDNSFGVSGVASYTNVGSSANIHVNSTGTKINSGKFQLTGNGQLDNTFGVNGIVAGFPRVTVMQPDGKTVGVTTAFTGTTSAYAVHRILPNGQYDNTFGINGIYTSNVSAIKFAAVCINLQSDGKILTGGNEYTVRLSNTISTALNDINKVGSIYIYPNPTKEFLNLELSAGFYSAHPLIKITNIIGEVVLTETLSTQNLKLNIQHFNSGIYFLQVGNSKAVKFIKE